MPLIVLLKSSKGPHESVSKARLAGTWAFIDAFIKRDSSLFIGLDFGVSEFQPRLQCVTGIRVETRKPLEERAYSA